MSGMKRSLEAEMDKRRARNFKRAGIEDEINLPILSGSCEEPPITPKRWQDKDLIADVPVKPITTEPPKTYGDKYKSLFDRGEVIKNEV